MFAGSLGLAGVILLVFAAVAFALDQTNGTGKTHLGNTIGYNVKGGSTLSGEIEYQTADNVYNVHCDDINSYTNTTTADGKYPKTIVNSTQCFGQAGDTTRYFMHIEFVDRGEPGTSDSICLTLKQYPGRSNPVLVKDCGIIQNGNVQIHGGVVNNDGTDQSTAMVSTQ